MATPHRDAADELLEFIAAQNWGAAEFFLRTVDLEDRIRAVATLPRVDRDELLAKLSPEQAAELVVLIPDVQAIEVIEDLEPHVAAAIVAELPSNEQADVVQQLDPSEAERILAQLPGEQAEQIRSLTGYRLDCAGGLMVKEYLAYTDTQTVGEVVRDLRTNAAKYRGYNVQYAYVVSESGALIGVLLLRELLLRDEHDALASVAIRHPFSVYDDASLEDLERFFDEHNYFGAPVVDRNGLLVGVIHRSDVEEAAADRAGSDYLKSQGIVGGEELRSMPLFLRSRKRLSWLSINIVLNILAASVIAANQDVLNQVIVLAVFLPIISDMSGCSGNQAVAVSMRELSLGVAKPADFFRVLSKEALVGVMNGLALGLLIGAVAGIWQGNLWLAIVVGIALAVNTLVAVCIGGCVPLLLRGLKKDPALASGPILTTVTDMCGFFLVLTLAGFVIERLPASEETTGDRAAPEAETAPTEAENAESDVSAADPFGFSAGDDDVFVTLAPADALA